MMRTPLRGTIHAESNAILQARATASGLTRHHLCDRQSCWNCFKEIANSGICRIVYGEFYRDDRIFSVAASLKIELLHLAARGRLCSVNDLIWEPSKVPMPSRDGARRAKLAGSHATRLLSVGFGAHRRRFAAFRS